jgi:hypothetical protein
MSPIGKFIIQQTDEHVTVNLRELRTRMFNAGYYWHSAKIICIMLGIGIQGGS